MVLETNHLAIHIASEEEMTCFIEKQTDKTLIKAYKEMLQGCLDHSEDWAWYAIGMIEQKGDTYVRDLCFKEQNDYNREELCFK